MSETLTLEKLMTRFGIAVGTLLVCGSAYASEPAGISATYILDLNDTDAAIALKAMALAGDNHTKLLAEAWEVLSSITMGEGRLRCGFPDETTKTMWQPSLDGMNKDEIYELNRVVTSNYRNAENGSSLDKRKLFPVSRQAINFLTDNRGAWDCKSMWEVKNKADAYIKARGGALSGSSCP